MAKGGTGKSRELLRTAADRSPGWIGKRQFFPRSAIWADVSPTFFAVNKDRFLRQLLIRDIEQLTEHRLIVYFASPASRPELGHEDIDYIVEMLDDLEPREKFDLLVESPGGLTDAADAIISILRKAGPFRALVPGTAKSNATLICLAAETLVMGPGSQIGPIDPLIGDQRIPASILARREFLEHPDPEVRVRAHAAANALKQTEKLAEKTLSSGMMKGSSDDELKNAVAQLCAKDDGPPNANGKAHKREFYSHGASINVEKAKELGLNVKEVEKDDQLCRLMRYLYSIYAEDCRKHRLSKIFEGSRVSMQERDG